MNIKVGDFVIRTRGAIAADIWERRWKERGQDPYSPKQVKYIISPKGLNEHIGFDLGIWWRAENFHRPVVEKDLEDYL